MIVLEWLGCRLVTVWHISEFLLSASQIFLAVNRSTSHWILVLAAKLVASSDGGQSRAVVD